MHAATHCLLPAKIENARRGAKIWSVKNRSSFWVGAKTLPYRLGYFIFDLVELGHRKLTCSSHAVRYEVLFNWRSIAVEPRDKLLRAFTLHGGSHVLASVCC